MWAHAPILILDLRNDPRHRLTIVAADERVIVVGFLAIEFLREEILVHLESRSLAA
jgi:hypothetical protein